MREVWLRPNRRALLCCMAPPLLLTLLGAALLAAAILVWSSATLAIIGVVTILAGSLSLIGLSRIYVAPRLAYQDGLLCVYLGRGGPQHVPIEIVEIFFRGQGPSMMHMKWGRAEAEENEVRNVIVRLAEAEKSWRQRQVHPWLGNWCEGQITIRGTWCEPLTRDVFERLNRRLVEVHRERKQQPHCAARAEREGA